MIVPQMDFLCAPHGHRLAYRLRRGSSPTLVFLPGYASDMEGTKALKLDAFAETRGVAMLRFDYSGTGASDGRFEDGTLSGWIDEAVLLIDQLTRGPIVLAGSSMGAWIALHLALLRADRVAGLAGVASAPDFTEWGFTADQKLELQRKGRLVLPNPYGDTPSVTTHEFWTSSQALRLLDGTIDVRCPVRLLHGDRDNEVPIAIPLRLMGQLRSADVQLTLIKGGEHRLSRPHEIDAILSSVDRLVELLK